VALKRVLIVNVRSLLIESVAGLLEADGNEWFDVVSTLANNLPDLLQEIEELKPGVLIVDKATSFMRPAELIVSLLLAQNMRLIVLDSQTSSMTIYDKCELMITNPSHFIDALKH
jgi:DNA-binding NarL/FixJ family response regulator